jgi:DNA-binding NarL/FixJ family response regulator
MSASSKDSPAIDNDWSFRATPAGQPSCKEKKAGRLAQKNDPPRPKMALVSANGIFRECLLPLFRGRLNAEITAFPSLDDWIQQAGASNYALVIFHACGDQQGRDLSSLSQVLNSLAERPNFVVLADSERPIEVRALYANGARGYIPTSLSLDVVTQAIKLVMVGGVYCPPCMLSVYDHDAQLGRISSARFTPREAAVFEAVRQGQPNKLIADEMGISESTIKVHVHRIMKKLNVHNRTQMAICQLDLRAG